LADQPHNPLLYRPTMYLFLEGLHPLIQPFASDAPTFFCHNLAYWAFLLYETCLGSMSAVNKTKYFTLNIMPPFIRSINPRVTVFPFFGPYYQAEDNNYMSFICLLIVCYRKLDPKRQEM
jgi:hypothetical protein